MPSPTGKWLRIYRNAQLNEKHDIFIDDKGNKLIFINGGEFFIRGGRCIYTDVNSGIEKGYKIIKSECSLCEGNGYITERQELEEDEYSNSPIVPLSAYLAMINEEIKRIKDGCKYCGTFHCTCYEEL